MSSTAHTFEQPIFLCQIYLPLTPSFCFFKQNAGKVGNRVCVGVDNFFLVVGYSDVQLDVLELEGD